MKEKEEQLEHIEELIQGLPKEMQEAIYWLIRNIKIVEQLSEGEIMTDEEIEQLTQSALDRKDYVMLALIKYKQVKDQREAENKEQEN